MQRAALVLATAAVGGCGGSDSVAADIPLKDVRAAVGAAVAGRCDRIDEFATPAQAGLDPESTLFLTCGRLRLREGEAGPTPVNDVLAYQVHHHRPAHTRRPLSTQDYEHGNVRLLGYMSQREWDRMLQELPPNELGHERSRP
jgi:hypothetical protein